jgi:xylan 1,4-beta-xylosidase
VSWRWCRSPLEGGACGRNPAAMKANLIAWAFLAASLMTGAGTARADDSPLRQITVDATVTVGALRPLSGIQAAAGSLDNTAFYKAAHIDVVRVADVPGAGTDAIFPDMRADAEDPKSYHFAAADRVIASIKSAGAEPLFQIGRDSGQAADASAAAQPPTDPDKFAEVARHIVLHYNQRWNKGFRYAIRYWEIGNEPDNKASWSGSPEEYYTLYAKTARAIESADAAALVGAPAIAKPLIAGGGRENFLSFVRSNRLSLDFFSWHFFAVDSGDPFTFVTVARELRRILDARGFGSTKNILDEWNTDPAEANMSKATHAAFVASALIYMLGGPIDAQTFFRADADLTGINGAPDEVGHALSAFGSLKNTPMLIRTTGGDESGLAVAAGRSRDGRLVQVLISNYEVASKYLKPRDNWDTSLPERRVLQYGNNAGYDATINLPEPGKYQVKRYRINESANFVMVDQSMQPGPTIHLQAALPPPGIDLIVISAN